MQAFSDLRVLDLTHVLAGPFATYQLAVLGADVIKIEGTTSFDMNREIGAVSAFNHQKMGTHFQAQAGNKRAIRLNLKTKAGREIFLKLASDADVIVENFRTGAMARLGLGYEDICKVNPRIVFCSITGFGQTGPKRSDAAYDNTIQAYSGMMSQNGSADEPPVLMGAPVLDYSTGLQAAFAISSALLRREKTGLGQHLDVAMLDTALMLMTCSVLNYNTTRRNPGRSKYSRAPYAAYGCYEASDGVLFAIGGVAPSHYAAIWRVLGREDLAAEMGGLTTMDMVLRAQSDEPAIAEAIATKTADEWERAFNKAGLPGARLRSLQEALESEQVGSRAVVGRVRSDVSSKGELRPTVAGFMCSQDGPEITTSPPEYGEHTFEVLSALGYAPGTIEDLVQEGTIGSVLPN